MLHLWWARRPLAACRAILMALLLPDPCDEDCPREFIVKARELLLGMHGRPEKWTTKAKTAKGLRDALLEFIGDFANWDNAANANYLATARDLIKTAHPGETPLVVDPFAGGGAIPLEALRLGCEAFASDLNPVACLILNSMLDNVPRCGQELANELERAGNQLQCRIREKLAVLYPADPDGAQPIAYLWARTVACESPNCGAEIPLVRSFWLRKKGSPKQALRYHVVRGHDNAQIEFEVFEPQSEREVPGATVFQAKATCPVCQGVLSANRVRAQLAAKRGGIEHIRLLAVVTQRAESSAKSYRTEQSHDRKAINEASRQLSQLSSNRTRKGLTVVPDEPIPRTELRRVSAPLYGCEYWSDLFTIRQRVALATVCEAIQETADASDKPDRILPFLTLAFGKILRHWNSNARWHNGSESVAGAFGRQAIPMAWTFPEQSFFGKGAGSLLDAVSSVVKAVQAAAQASGLAGQVHLADACNIPLPNESVNAWFTDPPYYDAVAYAHLADFFYIWFKRILEEDPFFKSKLINKDEECVVDRPHRLSPSRKTPEWFEGKMAEAMHEGRRILIEDGIGGVVFAHKTTEGWEALIGGMLRAGWVITASWPIATERTARLNARDNASLATSVHLICRPRPDDAPIGDWAEVLHELPKRVGDWMERLQGEGIRGADLVFACIGPALEIFSRYRKVETADGREVKLAEYLEKVWEVVGRTALEQVLGTAEAKARNGAAGALEEDARLTALFLWTLQATNGHNGAGGQSEEEDEADPDSGDDEEVASFKGKSKGFSLVFDVVRRFAQPLGIELPKWEGRVIETKKGVVRLLAVTERARQLFGSEGAESVAELIEQEPQKNIQLSLLPELQAEHAPVVRGRGGRRKLVIEPSALGAQDALSATTLDRVHAAMLLQAGGQTNALRALIKAEQDRSPDFLRLANALSALYPSGSEEKRLLDAMLLAVPR